MVKDDMIVVKLWIISNSFNPTYSGIYMAPTGPHKDVHTNSLDEHAPEKPYI